MLYYIYSFLFFIFYTLVYIYLCPDKTQNDKQWRQKRLSDRGVSMIDARAGTRRSRKKTIVGLSMRAGPVKNIYDPLGRNSSRKMTPFSTSSRRNTISETSIRYRFLLFCILHFLLAYSRYCMHFYFRLACKFGFFFVLTHTHTQIHKWLTQIRLSHFHAYIYKHKHKALKYKIDLNVRLKRSI